MGPPGARIMEQCGFNFAREGKGGDTREEERESLSCNNKDNML
jgi:hypothetical protein